MTRMPLSVDSIEDVDEWRRIFQFADKPIDPELSPLLFEELYRIHQKLSGREQLFFRLASKLIYTELYDLIKKMSLAHAMHGETHVEYFVADKERWGSIGNSLLALTDGAGSYPFNRWNNVYPKPKGCKRKTKLYLHGLTLIAQARKKKRILISPNTLTCKYTKKHFKEIFPVFSSTDIAFWFKRPRADAEVEKLARHTAQLLIDVLKNLAKKREMLPIRSDLEEALFSGLSRLYAQIDAALDGARSLARRMGKKVDAYTGTGGTFTTRVLSEALRERGGRVSGFPHGGGLAGLEHPLIVFNEFATCDRFCCLSALEAEDYKKYKLINPVEFFVEREIDPSILEVHKGYNKPERIDLNLIHTIMYVNSGSYYDRYVEGVAPDTVKFYAQLHLFDYLLTLNKKIIFKNRPKGKYLAGDFDHLGYYSGRIEYSSRPLTSMLDEAELFVFELIGSSALYEVMTLTDKPVVLFVPEGYEMAPVLRESLNRRCFVFEQKENEKHRLIPDIEGLSKILK